MMIGLPASGKSTLARRYSDEFDYLWLSSDIIREEISEMFDDRGSLNYHTFKIMNNLAIKLLLSGHDVVYDATNLNRKDRKKILKEVAKINKDHDIFVKAIFLDTSYNECIRRNNEREVKVPYEYMEMYRDKLQIPTLLEGFDSIEILKGD